jgi:hypothetical protein
MRSLHTSLLAGLLLLWVAPRLWAAPVYEVELLLFTWQGGAAISQPVAEERIGPLGGGLPAIEYDLLPKTQWRLEPESYTLGHSGGRAEPLLHLAWRQQVPPRDYPRVVNIRSSETAPNGRPQVEGAVVVSIGRNIHLDLDLLLREQAWRGRTSGPGLAPVGAAYRLQSHRKIKPGELNYIDHDRMGVLVTINRVGGGAEEAAPAEAAAEGEGPRADIDQLSRKPAGGQ